jgi:hypothetical protein
VKTPFFDSLVEARRRRVPLTPRVTMFVAGALRSVTFPCDEGCRAYACVDLEDEIAERVLGDRFERPWPVQSWVHHVGLPNGYARITFCWEGRS